jgi:CyaY protein
MDESLFDQLADQTLHRLLDALDRVDGIEGELSQGVLTIGFDAGGAPFIVNSHRAARQIWMAADRTAWHFDPNEDGSAWTTRKPPEEELFGALSAALSRKLGRTVALR